MKHKDFMRLVGDRLANCHNVLNQKDKEYSSEADRLHNFVAAGKMNNEDPIRSLWGMLTKHLVSFKDIIDEMDKDPEYIPSKELVAEKLGDVVNYTLLAEGVIEDRRKKITLKEAKEVDKFFEEAGPITQAVWEALKPDINSLNG